MHKKLLLTASLLACNAKDNTAMEHLPPLDDKNLAFTCVHEQDHVPPITPEADRLFHQARAMEKAPGPKDFDEIARLYTQAGDMGHWKALHNLQNLYYEGLVEHPHPEKVVIDINEKLIKLGAPMGYYNMATYLEQGYGVRQDEEAALAYYRKSADLGSPYGQTYTGKILVFKLKKFDVGIGMLTCAIEQGNGQAARELAEYYRAFRDDYKNALLYYHKAASLGHELSAHSLSETFGEGTEAVSGGLGVTIDQERARRYQAIVDEIERNPAARFPDIDRIVPLPPAPLPAWDGTFEYRKSVN
jgi:TPR repeat protein